MSQLECSSCNCNCYRCVQIHLNILCYGWVIWGVAKLLRQGIFLVPDCCLPASLPLGMGWIVLPPPLLPRNRLICMYEHSHKPKFTSLLAVSSNLWQLLNSCPLKMLCDLFTLLPILPLFRHAEILLSALKLRTGICSYCRKKHI